MPYLGSKPTDVFADRDLNGQELILDVDGDTSVTSDSDDQIDFRVGGSDQIKIAAGEVAFNDASGDIDFRVESNGNTHAIFVDAGNDYVGIGKSAPAGLLHVSGGNLILDDGGSNPSSVTSIISSREDTTNINMMWNTHTNASPYGPYWHWTGAAPDDNSRYMLQCADNVTARLKIQSDGDVVNHDNSYGSLSDERIKEDIRDAGSQWDDIKALRVRKFKKKDDVRQYGDEAWEQIGVIAQELELVSPKLIRRNRPSFGDILSDSTFGTLYTEDDLETQGDSPTANVGEIKEVKENVLSVSYSVLYMKAIKALQEAMARIETLEAEVAALKG